MSSGERVSRQTRSTASKKMRATASVESCFFAGFGKGRLDMGRGDVAGCGHGFRLSQYECRWPEHAWPDAASPDWHGVAPPREGRVTSSARSSRVRPAKPELETDLSTLADEVRTRRTFAIISHPDAGKTTLTENLLLMGGAIHLAGQVKARGDSRRARSDWMKIEQERGISVSSAVMTFAYEGITCNLLDTPGHEDFSEDTYRTLTAADSAIMVIDAAKGIEAQTLKLFEVCRLRDVPIITFINKIDREGVSPFELMDEIATKLALDTAPMMWPAGMGGLLRGIFDPERDRFIPYDRMSEGKEATSLSGNEIANHMSAEELVQFREEMELAREGSPAFDLEAYRAGHLTPVYFGSALRKLGVRELLNAVVQFAPSPRPQPSSARLVQPDEPKVAGFVFKVQANMDANHRDRIAFMRICSGRFKRGMRLKVSGSGKTIGIHNPTLFSRRIANSWTRLSRATSSAFRTTARSASAIR